MSVVPQSLAVSLKRFQNAVFSVQRVTGDRSSYLPSQTITLDLPRSGVIKTDSLSLVADLFASHASVTSGTTPDFHSSLIRRIDISIGGVVLPSPQDYGFVHRLTATYGLNKSKADMMQAVGREGNLPITISSGGTTTPAITLLSWWANTIFDGKFLSYLPLDILPPVQLQIQLNSAPFWLAGVDTSAYTVRLDNVKLIYERADFQGNMLAEMYAKRLQSVPIEIPFNYARYIETASTSASATQFNGFINSQSVNEIAVLFRPDDYATASAHANRVKAYYGGSAPSTTLLNVSWNGSQLVGFDLNAYEALLTTQMALNGNGNIIYAPDSESDTDLLDSKFALVLPMELALGPEDGKGWVTGTSTMGQSTEIAVRMSGGDTNAKKGVVVVYATGSLSVGAGRQVAVAE